jgi:hypothetical protein
MAELWAYCGLCTRWYYCPQPQDPRASLPDCPVCQSPPTGSRTEHQPEVAAT